jgi:hypoxanthine phosphoribosyltransferase
MEEYLVLYQASRYVQSAYQRMSLEIAKFGLEDLCFLSVLKGGSFVLGNILRYLPIDESTIFGNIRISSYKGESTKSSGQIELCDHLDLEKKDIDGRHVWLVDDIVDTGLTICFVKNYLQAFLPASIRTCVLVDKPMNRVERPSAKPEVSGFEYLGNSFLVGCGLGFGEKFRGLKQIYELQKK